MYRANPSLNFDWCRWWEEKKRTVSVQDWERKAADFGGDEEKDSAPDWQQLDSSAQQQLLQGTHLCWSSSEEVDAQYTHHSLGSCFGYVGSSVFSFFFFFTAILFSELHLLSPPQIWFSGQPGHFASGPAHNRSFQLPSSTLSCCRLLCSEQELLLSLQHWSNCIPEKRIHGPL